MKSLTKFLSALAIGFHMFSLTVVAQKSLPAEKIKQMHQEKVEDAYLPNAFQNKKVSPAYKYSNTVKSKTTNSTIFTTQVNVDLAGQNILFDAANEPGIAINPLNPNVMVIGWRQFDNILSNFRQAGWAYTTDAGQNWVFPGVIEPGVFRSDPVLDFDSAGNFYYNSLTNSPDYFCKVFISNDGGVSWDSGTDAQGGDKQWMTIDRTPGVGGGNIYSSWTSNYSTCLPGFFTRSTNNGTSYENCTLVDGDPYWISMAVGINGELYIAGGGAFSDMVVAKSLNAKIPGSTITWTYTDVFMDGHLDGWTINWAGLLGQANIDIDRSNGPGQGNVYVLASLNRLSNSDQGDVMFVRSTDDGATWSTPLKINDDNSVLNYQWFGTMSVAPNGRIDAVWLDTREDQSGSDSSALYYSYSTNQGVTWSANEKLSDLFDPHVGYPNQDKIGDYFDMISDNTGAHLAWAGTFNGEQDVYYSYIVPPVSSGVEDHAAGNTLTVFPNPSPGVITVLCSAKNVHIEIYNTLGEIIQSQPLLTSTTEIDLSDEPAGLYFLKNINPDGGSSVMKIIRD